MTTNSTITISINAQNNATSTINSVNASLGGLSSSGTTASNVMSGLKVAALATAAALAALAAAGIGVLANATNQAAEFEQALANVKAATGATADQMAAMRKEALGIGQDTSKSAKEAVDAMGELAKAGMNVEDITAGVGRAVVNLSEATDYSMTESAILVSNAVNNFKASGLSAQDAAEMMAKAANASAISMGDLSYAIQNAGSVSSAANIPFKDLMIMTGILGNNGLKGADGATSLKTAILALAAPSKDAAGALGAMGVSFYDATESFRPMKDVIQDLHVAMADMTDAQIMENLKDVFGTDAIRGMIPLIRAGKEGWDEFNDAMDKAPSIAEQAKIRLATLQGRIEAFKGSIETANIVVGEAFLPLLSRMTDNLNTAFNSVDWERVGQGLGAFIELLTVSDPEQRIGQYERLAEALGNPKAAERVALLTSAFHGLTQALSGDWTGGLERIRAGLQGLGGDQAVTGFNSIIQAMSIFAPIAETVRGAIQGVVDAIVNEIPKIAESMGPAMEVFNAKMIEARQELPGLSNAIQELVIGFGTFTEAIVKVWGALEQWLAPILMMLVSAIIPAAIRVLAELFSQIGTSFGLLGGIISAAVDVVKGIFEGDWDKVLKAAGSLFTNFYDLVKLQIESIPKLLDSLLGGMLTKAQNWSVEMGKAIGGGLVGMFGGGGQANVTVPVEARAEGGGIEAFRPYLVGEEGPELIVPRGSGMVIPNDATTSLLSRVGVDINLSVAGTVGDEQQQTAIERIVAEVIQSLKGEFSRMELGASL